MQDFYEEEEHASFNVILDALIAFLQAAHDDVVAARQCPDYRQAQALVSRVLAALATYLKSCKPPSR
jgi:hypothetical protein